MLTIEERIAVLEVEFRNMSGNLKDIKESVVGINTTLSNIAMAMAEGKGAIRLGTYLSKAFSWLYCAICGLIGGLAAQKAVSIADKVAK